MKYLVMIVGPTAVGKTEFAIKVARYFGTGIISADSRQVYKEMLVGTAVPEPEQLAMVKHYQIGHRSIMDNYNVSLFELEALESIDTLHQLSDVAVMTGGSGLYCDVLENGIDDLPDIDPEVRKRLNEEYRNKGLIWLQQEVAVRDPDYFSSIDQKNPARLLRALEVIVTTGKKFSSLRIAQKRERPFAIIKSGLLRPKEELSARIELRVDRMISEGLIDECRTLYHVKNKNALKSVGYKEIFNWLDGLTSFEEAVEKIKTNTRRYAKRQMTWFRRDSNIKWYHPDDIESYLEWLTISMDELKRKNKNNGC